MTPRQRVEAACTCPLGLALMVKQGGEKRWCMQLPGIGDASKVLGIERSHAKAIADWWDHPSLIDGDPDKDRAANEVAQLGLI